MICNLLKAWGKSCVQGEIGFDFGSHWLKDWCEVFKPISKRSNRKPIIIFDSPLKTALSTLTRVHRGCPLTSSCLDMFAVIGRGLFYEVAPTRFGTLGKAFFTLFQLITLDDWFFMYSDVVAKSPGLIFGLQIYILKRNVS